MALKNAIVVFMISLLALPFSYFLNTVTFYGKDQRLTLLAGAFCLLLVAILPQIVLQKRSKPQKMDSFFHVMSLLTFSSVFSLITALENDGLIAEFLGCFLREGMPYMKTAYGTMVSYWDGIGHNAIYMMMIAALLWNQSFCDVGLYWVGSFGHRLLVLVVAVAMSSEGLGWIFLMQVPFIAICCWAGWKFTREKAEESNALYEELVNDDVKVRIGMPIWRKPLSLLLVIFYFSAGCFTLFRFICTMGGKSPLVESYTRRVEPYLNDPSPFSKAEILVQTFYFIPYYGLSIFALILPGQSWVPPWALIHAGAAGQGQFTYMGASIHYRTPYIYRIPQTTFARSLFWLFNGILFIVPQIAAFLFNSEPDFFLFKSPTPEKVDPAPNRNGKTFNESIINKYKKYE